MAALNSIVMFLCALWVLVHLDRRTKRDRSGPKQPVSSKTRFFHSRHQ